MNRKNFLSSLIPLTFSISAIAKEKVGNKNIVEKFDKEISGKIPPFLEPGDTIGITCPSGYLTLEDTRPAVDKMKEWGFSI